jgi:very-short-patch-repair endonuclease
MKKISNHLIERSRLLRQNQSDAEGFLWKFLRGRFFQEFRFRRQKIIGPYIVDFLCCKAKLVIELDGGQHNERIAIDYDTKRTEFLNSRGYKVVRFWNNEVFSNTDNVLLAIWQQLSVSTPTPSPPPQAGEGAVVAKPSHYTCHT